MQSTRACGPQCLRTGTRPSGARVCLLAGILHLGTVYTSPPLFDRLKLSIGSYRTTLKLPLHVQNMTWRSGHRKLLSIVLIIIFLVMSIERPRISCPARHNVRAHLTEAAKGKDALKTDQYSRTGMWCVPVHPTQPRDVWPRWACCLYSSQRDCGAYGKLWGCVQEHVLGESHARSVYDPVPRDRGKYSPQCRYGPA